MGREGRPQTAACDLPAGYAAGWPQVEARVRPRPRKSWSRISPGRARLVIIRAHGAEADFWQISLGRLPQPVIIPQVRTGPGAVEALDLMQFRGVASQSSPSRGLARQGKIQACRYPCKRRASQTVQRRARRTQGGGSNLPSGSARAGEDLAASNGNAEPTRDPSCHEGPITSTLATRLRWRRRLWRTPLCLTCLSS